MTLNLILLHLVPFTLFHIEWRTLKFSDFVYLFFSVSNILRTLKFSKIFSGRKERRKEQIVPQILSSTIQELPFPHCTSAVRVWGGYSSKQLWRPKPDVCCPESPQPRNNLATSLRPK